MGKMARNDRLDPLYTQGRMDIQTDGDYIKRVAHGPSGATCLKNKKAGKLSTVGEQMGWGGGNGAQPAHLPPPPLLTVLSSA